MNLILWDILGSLIKILKLEALRLWEDGWRKNIFISNKLLILAVQPLYKPLPLTLMQKNNSHNK